MEELARGRRDGPPRSDAPASRWVHDWQHSKTLGTLRRLLNTSGQVTPALARRTGLSHTELSVLEHVMEEPMGPSELAQRIGVTTAAASGIVDRLVARGHAERQPHPTDRRRTAVTCTSSGREELMEHLMPMFLELAALDDDFTDAELQVIHRFLVSVDRAVARLL